VLWRHREDYAAALVLAAAVALTPALGFLLLDRTPTYHPWLRWVVLVLGLSAALMLGAIRQLPRRGTWAVVAAALVASLAAPAAYTLSTVSTPHSGSIPSAGPSVAGAGFGGGPGGAPGGGAGGFGQAGGFGGGGGNGSILRGVLPAPPGQTMGRTPTGQTPGGAPTGRSSAGSLLDGSTPSARITTLLTADASDYTWVGAAIGSNSAAGFQLASQEPVMAIGGFNGSDPSPTLAQFKAIVAQGKIHYFIGSGSQGGGGVSPGGSTSNQISTWVAAHVTAKTVDGVTLYDLSGGVQ
jgi:4-amino-4-deoxy-L-arabinose transferase-like glycosyltransferase